MSSRKCIVFTCAGPDSPTSPVKDLSTHTRAMKLKHQALEDRLQLCLLELKKLCIREAVSNIWLSVFVVVVFNLLIKLKPLSLINDVNSVHL